MSNRAKVTKSRRILLVAAMLMVTIAGKAASETSVCQEGNPQPNVNATVFKHGEFDIKTNLLNDVVGTMSLGLEVPVSQSWSFNLAATWNPWTFTDHTLYKQWTVSPQMKRWFGHQFVGINLTAGEYNYSRVRLPFNMSPSLKGHRLDGWIIGGGVSYGYRFNVSNCIAIELEAGVGVGYVRYDKYACGTCGEKLGLVKKCYVGMDHTSVNLILRL